jgi:hypothetical protein
MELVLSDIAKWKTQLEGEIIKIDEQVTHLTATKKVAEQKVKEAEALLAEHEFTAEVVEDSEEAGPVAEAAEG